MFGAQVALLLRSLISWFFAYSPFRDSGSPSGRDWRTRTPGGFVARYWEEKLVRLLLDLKGRVTFEGEMMICSLAESLIPGTGASLFSLARRAEAKGKRSPGNGIPPTHCILFSTQTNLSKGQFIISRILQTAERLQEVFCSRLRNSPAHHL